MMRSLQTRLLLTSGLASALVLVGAGIVLYLMIRRTLQAEFDAALANEIQTLAVLVEYEQGIIKTEMAERQMPQFMRVERPDYYQLWQENGAVLERSARLMSNDLARVSGELAAPEYRYIELPDGRPGRVAGATFTVKHADAVSGSPTVSSAMGGWPRITLAVATDTLGLNRTLDQLATLLLVVVGCTVAISQIVTAIIVRYGLKPLGVTATSIAAIDPGSLSTRLDSSAVPREVLPITYCLNELLKRLDNAFQRERAFSSNVAHELRTPLAGLRSTIDVTLSKTRAAADYRTALEDCLLICNQTDAVVENLLTLARIDAGQAKLHRERFPLNELVRDEWRPLAKRALARRLSVQWNLCDGLEVNTDRAKLQLIVRNLLDNAVGYTDTGGRITVTSEWKETKAVVTITNTHPGLSPAQVDRVFDRFWRGSVARKETGIHSGLGLSLCQSLTESLGGSITATSGKEGQFQIRLEVNALERCTSSSPDPSLDSSAFKSV